ncbi:MAG: acetyl-CoA carboxylase carboxyl transferase subunit alpha, partial [Flavobacteriales bacterium CG18_big_fil_WC_8_21_14_2_50_32_9]
MSNYILDFESPLKAIEEKIDILRLTAAKTGENVSSNIKKLEQKLEQKKADIYSKLSRWDRVQLARHPDRPYSLDYIRMMSGDFFELHGDRYFAD